jgi:hypothetical protein
VAAARVLDRNQQAELPHQGDVRRDGDVDPGLELRREAAVVELVRDSLQSDAGSQPVRVCVKSRE